MITGIFIVLLFIILICSIIYGQRLIRVERVDAVFGNPDRANGGYHWVVAGSCTILILWLFFSWDIAKSFYPNSANELCQVGKVREALTSLKYSFPIEQRWMKSTAVIKRETKIINELKIKIRHSNIKSNDKEKLIVLLSKMSLLISSLTEKKNLDPEVERKINTIANRIRSLSENFRKEDYPLPFTVQEKNERIKLLQSQTKWGETGMEIPPLPETRLGEKFESASIELTSISDDFFSIKNDNPIFLKVFKDIKQEIKIYRKKFTDDQEVEKEFLKAISKIAGRISRGRIFPPNTLNVVQNSLVEFENIQRVQQGTLAILDTLLFPGGTIVASGDVCSEQGPGRWLPKPSDTARMFLFLLNPTQGFKNVPLIWYEMIGFNRIIDFIIPDWFADILPGEYPVHASDGSIEPNFKSLVLSVAVGDFNSFSIPVPNGHIWDSFLRVFLGLSLGVICGIPLGLFMGLSRFGKGYFDPLIELYRPVPPLAWAPLIITVFGIDNSGKIFLLFMVSFAIMVISARAGASGTQLSKIHAAHSLGASKWQILKEVIFPNSLPEILTGIRVSIGVCWGTLVAAEFLAGTTGIGFVENVARKYMQYEVIWITIFVMGLLGLVFDLFMRRIISRTTPWRGKG